MVRMLFFWLFLSLSITHLSAASSRDVKAADPINLDNDSRFMRKFEYQYSFKGPQLTINNQVPFWTVGESAMASEERIRLVPSIRSKRGFAWAKNALESPYFEVEVQLKVSGVGRLGADGMAVWFTDSPGFEGAVYGNRDMWTGLGIFLDSYDNNGKGDNPYISAVYNDGTKTYDHPKDGGDQVLAGCQMDFRNKPFPIVLRIIYFKETLEVYYSRGLTPEPDYDFCLKTQVKAMPTSKYLGVSAATGGLADDHDVFSFLTFTLIPTEDVKDRSKFSEDEINKMKDEFKKFSDNIEERKQDFKKENPDRFAHEEEVIEDVAERQLRQVYEGQQRLFRMVAGLREAISRIEDSAAGGGGGSATSADHKSFQTELQSLKSIINHISLTAAESKTAISDIQSKVMQISNAQKQGNVGSGKAGSSSQDLDLIKRELSAIKGATSKREQMRCPEVDLSEMSCVSSGLFVTLFLVQMVIMVAYFYMRLKKEQANKKFF